MYRTKIVLGKTGNPKFDAQLTQHGETVIADLREHIARFEAGTDDRIIYVKKLEDGHEVRVVLSQDELEGTGIQFFICTDVQHDAVLVPVTIQSLS